MIDNRFYKNLSSKTYYESNNPYHHLKEERQMKTIKYEAYTDSIRLMPQNYCLAFRDNGKWHAYDDHAVKALWGIVGAVCFIYNLFI